jgi:acyl-coenzyme A synthetase/AMP-(fatty) acid ligase
LKGRFGGRGGLKSFVRTRPHKYPRSIAFIAELPKTATKDPAVRLRQAEQAAASG